MTGIQLELGHIITILGGLGVSITGICTWIFKLHSKINQIELNEKEIGEMKKETDKDFLKVEQDIESVIRDLRRYEEKTEKLFTLLAEIRAEQKASKEILVRLQNTIYNGNNNTTYRSR